jgi:putative Mg2+ transporter-C (MgtC) family protein
VFDSFAHFGRKPGTLGHVGLAFVLMAADGWETEQEAHSTGVRTFPIVGMASRGYLLLLRPAPDAAAQSRVVQGSITGIGFVGGGAILKKGATVKDTAMAASIRNAAAIGASVVTDGGKSPCCSRC